MKRTLTLIACVAVCCAMMASCKSAKTAEPTSEEIQAQKVALADSVLAEIDALAEQFYDTQSKSFSIKSMKLTDAEKMIKPDYLLNPSVASTLVTKSQKINALAIYFVELSVRMLYEMPCDEVKEVIARLAAEVNHPIEGESLMSNAPASDKIKREYEICKERGELAYFWQFKDALIVEIDYIMSQNPELFFNNITEEQWQAFHSGRLIRRKAIVELAKYDEEMAIVLNQSDKNKITVSSDEELKRILQSKDSVKQFRIATKDKYTARRNALLQ